MADPPSRHVAVIGAGADGPTAARHLLEVGYRVTMYESGWCLGSSWVYDHDNGLSAVCDPLTINSEPETTQLPAAGRGRCEELN
jgi:predicted NAD/FAD-binding protein